MAYRSPDCIQGSSRWYRSSDGIQRTLPLCLPQVGLPSYLRVWCTCVPFDTDIHMFSSQSMQPTYTHQLKRIHYTLACLYYVAFSGFRKLQPYFQGITGVGPIFRVVPVLPGFRHVSTLVSYGSFEFGTYINKSID